MAYNTIQVAGEFRQLEFTAGASGIYPGMLIKMHTTTKQVVVHSTEGGRGLRMFAKEDSLQGALATTVYASGQPVQCILPERGAEVQAVLESGYNYTAGTMLISAGNGKLKPLDAVSSAEDEIAVIAPGSEVDLSAGVDTLKPVIII